MTLTMERRPTRQDRVDTIHQMLLSYDAARSEGSSLGGGGSVHDSRINTFDSTTYTDAYRELDRCLDRLRYLAQHGRPILDEGVSSSAAWWAIRMRYFECVVVRRKVHLKKNPHTGERQPAPLYGNCEIVSRPTSLHGSAIEILPERGSVSVAYMLVRTWDSRVDAKIVGAALRWLSREYRGQPRVYDEAA